MAKVRPFLTIIFRHKRKIAPELAKSAKTHLVLKRLGLFGQIVNFYSLFARKGPTFWVLGEF